MTAAKVRPLRPYDLRHTFASLLIAAGKNPLYIAQQLGHYSAGFTLDTYGHLMESVPAGSGRVDRRNRLPRGLRGCTQIALVWRSAECSAG